MLSGILVLWYCILWEAATGQGIRTFMGHHDRVQAVGRRTADLHSSWLSLFSPHC
jgi:hypothetical protein